MMPARSIGLVDSHSRRVAMHNAEFVCRLERVGDLAGQANASSTGTAPRAIRSASVWPSTSSITRARPPFCAVPSGEPPGEAASGRSTKP